MAKDKDPVAEAAERLERIRERRAVIERLPDSPSKQNMLQTNTSALMKAEAEVGTLQAGPTETLWDRASLAASDWLDEKLMIGETFQAANQTGLPESEGNMGRTDRARHLLWTSKLAERYGKPMAAVITTFKEGENLFLDPFKKLRLIGDPKHTTASINEEQFEAIKETGRDFKTNMFALRNMPTGPDGKPRAFTPEEAREIVENMVTTPTPLNERQVAPAPSGLLRDDREVTTTQYGERPELNIPEAQIDREMELFKNATPEQQQALFEFEQRIRAERDLAETPPMAPDEFRQKALPLERSKGGAPLFKDSDPQFTTGGGPGRPGQIVGGAKKFTFREDI